LKSIESSESLIYTRAQWLHEHRHEGCTPMSISRAAGRGALAVVEWLHLHRPECRTLPPLDWPAMNDDLQIVEWLYTHGVQATSEALNAARHARAHRVVQYLTPLLEEGTPERLAPNHDAQRVPMQSLARRCCLFEVEGRGRSRQLGRACSRRMRTGGQENGQRTLHVRGRMWNFCSFIRDRVSVPAVRARGWVWTED
jgi:hypothetical protein